MQGRRSLCSLIHLLHCKTCIVLGVLQSKEHFPPQKRGRKRKVLNTLRFNYFKLGQALRISYNSNRPYPCMHASFFFFFFGVIHPIRSTPTNLTTEEQRKRGLCVPLLPSAPLYPLYASPFVSPFASSFASSFASPLRPPLASPDLGLNIVRTERMDLRL